MDSSDFAWIVGVMFLSFAISEARHLDPEERRTIICDRLEDGLKDGFLICFSQISQEVNVGSVGSSMEDAPFKMLRRLQDAIMECGKKILPSENLDMKTILEEGCSNRQILEDFSSCCTELMSDESSMAEINKSKNDPDIKKCFEGLEEKFGIHMWFD